MSDITESANLHNIDRHLSAVRQEMIPTVSNLNEEIKSLRSDLKIYNEQQSIYSRVIGFLTIIMTIATIYQIFLIIKK